MDRVAPLLQKAVGSPEYNMKVLMRALHAGVVPQVDKYYVIVYKAKTKNIIYDQHPFIVCTGDSPWGFTGVNFHIGARRYSWLEVISNTFEIKQEEVESMKAYPIQRFIQT